MSQKPRKEKSFWVYQSSIWPYCDFLDKRLLFWYKMNKIKLSEISDSAAFLHHPNCCRRQSRTNFEVRPSSGVLGWASDSIEYYILLASLFQQRSKLFLVNHFDRLIFIRNNIILSGKSEQDFLFIGWDQSTGTLPHRMRPKHRNTSSSDETKTPGRFLIGWDQNTGTLLHRMRPKHRNTSSSDETKTPGRFLIGWGQNTETLLIGWDQNTGTLPHRTRPKHRDASFNRSSVELTNGSPLQVKNWVDFTILQ